MRMLGGMRVTILMGRICRGISPSLRIGLSGVRSRRGIICIRRIGEVLLVRVVYLGSVCMYTSLLV